VQYRWMIVAVLLSAPWASRADEPIFETGAKLKVEAEGGAGGEGPAWHPKLGVLMSGNDNIQQLDRDGKSKVYRKDAGTNGLLFDAQGRLLACEPKLRRITRMDADGKITFSPRNSAASATTSPTTSRSIRKAGFISPIRVTARETISKFATKRAKPSRGCTASTRI
jgi:hypothetical protein